MKKYILMIAVFFSIGISGCKKNYLSLEVNPNQPSVSPPALTLAAALATAAANVNQSYPEYGCWVGFWTNSGNFVPNIALDEFVITNTSYTGVWTTLYQNLTNFNNLQVTAAKDPTLKSYQAIAMIMKVYDFQQLVDQFGDVAYSQAFQPSTILNPAYDNQQAIYNDLVKQLDAAIGLIGGGGASPAGDIVFSANGAGMTGWAKFANTLKLRLAIRQSTKNKSNAAAAALAATSSIGYLDATTDAEANPGYANTLSGSNSQQSPFWATFGFDVNGNSTFPNTYYRGNNFYITTLNNFNDPRINQIYAPTAGTGTVGGNTFGDVSAAVKSNTNTSAPGPGLLKSYSMNAVLMNSAEALFLQAEGALEGYISGDPQTLYEAGIKASFQAMGLTAAQAVTYYSQAIKNVGWAASTNKQEAIIYQKWIALTGYSNLEAFLEFQRTGFPVLPSPLSADPSALSTFAPVRQFYPLSELTSNSASVAKEGTINIFTTKIFWEK
ncbi:MAG TPA: SusD/RagB family nutrient-binding outer membrane lipoprotein [Mucilaginibacter sp.]|jgi:hypothetical protein